MSASGYGPIRIGWTVAELNAALNENVRPAYQASDECGYIHPARLPVRVNLMVVKDTVVRIDVDTAGVLTDKGAGVGDPEQRIAEMYGPVTVQFHKYRPEGRNLIVTDPSDSMLRMAAAGGLRGGLLLRLSRQILGPQMSQISTS